MKKVKKEIHSYDFSKRYEFGFYTHRIHEITDGLKLFNIKSKVYIKNNSYFIQFFYKKLKFIVNLDYNKSFVNIYVDIILNKKIIKSFVYDKAIYLFNLLAFICFM